MMPTDKMLYTLYLGLAVFSLCKTELTHAQQANTQAVEVIADALISFKIAELQKSLEDKQKQVDALNKEINTAPAKSRVQIGVKNKPKITTLTKQITDLNAQIKKLQKQGVAANKPTKPVVKPIAPINPQIKVLQDQIAMLSKQNTDKQKQIDVLKKEIAVTSAGKKAGVASKNMAKINTLNAQIATDKAKLKKAQDDLAALQYRSF